MPAISKEPVSTIMTTQVVAVTEAASLYDCRRLFEKHDFHHLPVVDGETLVGILSSSDLVAAGVSRTFPEDTDEKVRSSFEAEAMTVVDHVHRDPVTLAPGDSIGLAASMLAQASFHALPIVEDGKLVGIITTADLLQLLFDDD